MMAKNVKLTIGVPSATISKVSVGATDNLDLNLKPEGSSEEIDIPTLNASESIAVQLQADRSGALPNRPDVYVRGDDCVGKEEDYIARDYSRIIWLDLTAVAIIIIILVIYKMQDNKMMARLRKTYEEDDKKRTDVKKEIEKLRKEVDEIREDNILTPRFVLAYACRVAGDSKMADEYLTRSGEIAFWPEADRLADWVLVSNEQTEMYRRFHYFESVLGIIVEFSEISDRTRSIFILAAMKAASKGIKDFDMRYSMRKAYELNAEIAKSRISIDDDFKSFRGWLAELEAEKKASEVKSLPAPQ